MNHINLPTEHLKRVLTPLTAFSQAQVNFQSDAVYIEATKKSRAAQVCITVPSSLFRNLSITDSKIGICPENLLSVVQLLDNNLYVDLCIDSIDKITIRSDGLKYETYAIDPKYIRNADIGNKEWSENSVCAKVTGANLFRGLNLADKIATHCKLEFCPNDSSIVLSASGDTDNLKEYVPVDDMHININRPEENAFMKINNHYPLDYLCEIHELIPDTATVDLSLKQSLLTISYPIVHNVGNICFTLAESINPQDP